MSFTVIHGDITTMATDAIVNAANSRLAPGGGVCGAIFSASDYHKLDLACRKIGHCPVGQAVITPSFGMPAKYIVHAVGPIWQGGQQNEAKLLRDCYTSSLNRAKQHGCTSIAFPLISAGIYGYPKEEALRVAVDAIRAFLDDNEMTVYLVLFDRRAVVLPQAQRADVQAYIDDHYFERFEQEPVRRNEAAVMNEQLSEQAVMMSMRALPTRSLEDLVSHLDDSFSAMLLRLIDERGETDAAVYKRANIDRKLFSKIRKDSYKPSKQTATALALALRLDLDEAVDLLGRAGYALSRSSKFDVIILYCIENQLYDIYEVNEILFAFDQKLLGA